MLKQMITFSWVLNLFLNFNEYVLNEIIILCNPLKTVFSKKWKLKTKEYFFNNHTLRNMIEYFASAIGILGGKKNVWARNYDRTID